MELNVPLYGAFSFLIFALPPGETMICFLILNFFPSSTFPLSGFWRPMRSSLLIWVYGSLCLAFPSLTCILLMIFSFSSAVVAPLRRSLARGDSPSPYGVLGWPALR